MACGRHENIDILTRTEVAAVTGVPGDFHVTLQHLPRFVDPDRCVGCGLCSRECPVRPEPAIHGGRGPVLPLHFCIDADRCLHFADQSCHRCVTVCPAGAIDFDDRKQHTTLRAGALILAPGLQPCPPDAPATLAMAAGADILTSLAFEDLLARSGRQQGLYRPSDQGRVKSLAFLQCVGSRDIHRAGHAYCSTICCMISIKQALAARQLEKNCQITLFFIDMRCQGRDGDRWYERACSREDIRFVRCRVQGVEPHGQPACLRIRYVSDQGCQVEEEADLVVLATGLETTAATRKLADLTGLRLTAHHFGAVSDFAPVSGSPQGLFPCGTLTGPKDIGQCVTEGMAAAAAAAALLARQRHQDRRVARVPPERDIQKEPPRIGIILCHCGTNIGGVLDLQQLARTSARWPGVIRVEQLPFACGASSRQRIVELLVAHRLNRLVVAACSPLQYSGLFQDILREAGLNPHLLAMVNLRHQVSWVHGAQPGPATEKSADLLRMGVARVGLQQPLVTPTRPLVRRALVIGGGLAGMCAALNLAHQGFPVVLVEKSDQLGGNALHLHVTWSGEHVPLQLENLRRQVEQHPLITLYLQTEVVAASGSVGHFTSRIRRKGRRSRQVDHGVTILATGGSRLMPEEYGYRKYPNVLTALEFDKLHEINDLHVQAGHTFVFIQCVGSREPERNYCSRVCCTHAVQTAIDLKKERPERRIYILYRDIRTYAQREPLFTRARELGVVFINYGVHGKPRVRRMRDRLQVEVWDHVLHRPLLIRADLLILAVAILPSPGTRKMADLYGVNRDQDGFIQEAHAKLHPVETAVDGVLVAGLAHHPKPVEESIAQALATAGQAATLLGRNHILCDPLQARILPERCDGCGVCIDICPYGALTLAPDTGQPAWERLLLEPSRCRGCGHCQGICPKQGIEVAGFTASQLLAEISAALEEP